MIEDVLINYGVAGAMIVYFIADKSIFQKGLTKVIENNTIAMTRMYEVIMKCPRAKKV